MDHAGWDYTWHTDTFTPGSREMEKPSVQKIQLVMSSFYVDNECCIILLLMLWQLTLCNLFKVHLLLYLWCLSGDGTACLQQMAHTRREVPHIASFQTSGWRFGQEEAVFINTALLGRRMTNAGLSWIQWWQLSILVLVVWALYSCCSLVGPLKIQSTTWVWTIIILWHRVAEMLHVVLNSIKILIMYKRCQLIHEKHKLNTQQLKMWQAVQYPHSRHCSHSSEGTSTAGFGEYRYTSISTSIVTVRPLHYSGSASTVPRGLPLDTAGT